MAAPLHPERLPPCRARSTDRRTPRPVPNGGLRHTILGYVPRPEPGTYYVEMDPGAADQADPGLAEDVLAADWVPLRTFSPAGPSPTRRPSTVTGPERYPADQSRLAGSYGELPGGAPPPVLLHIRGAGNEMWDQPDRGTGRHPDPGSADVTRLLRDPVVAAAVGATVVLRRIGPHPYRYVDPIDYDTVDFTGRSRRPWATPPPPTGSPGRTRGGSSPRPSSAACWSLLAPRDRHRGATPLVAPGSRAGGAGAGAVDLGHQLGHRHALGVARRVGHRPPRRRPPARHPGAHCRAAVAVSGATLLWVFTGRTTFVLLGLAVVSVLVDGRPAGRRAGGRSGWWSSRVDWSPSPSGGALYGLQHGDPALQPGDGGHASSPTRAAGGSRDHGTPLLPPPAGRRHLPRAAARRRRLRRLDREDGSGTYARFLLTHPGARSPSRSTTSWPTGPRTPTRPGRRHHAVDGRGVRLGPPGDPRTGRRPGLRPRAPARSWWRSSPCSARAPTGAPRRTTDGWCRLLVVLQWPALTAVWHVDGRAGRLALVSAVALRIGLLAQAEFFWTGWLGDDTPTPICHEQGPSRARSRSDRH